MQKPLNRANIESLAERIEAFAAGLDDDERDALAYLFEAASHGGKRSADYSTPVAALLAVILDNQQVHPGISIQYFPWIRHKSPVFDNMVVKPSN